MAYILSIDIGTSRVKAALIDAAGKLLHLESRSVNRSQSPDTQSVEEWYVLAAECIQILMKNTAIRPDVIALTGNMHALLCLDAKGQPLAPAELWCSNSATAESDELNRRYGKEILQRTGNPVTPVFTLPKLLRMKKQNPEMYQNTAVFLQVKDYIAFRLTGKTVSDGTDSSGTLLYRLDTLQWDDELIAALGLHREKFPEVIPSASVCGTVTEHAHRETLLPQGTPVVIGSGDLSSAALGAGTDTETLSLTLGTAGQLLAVGERKKYPALAGKLFAFVHADPEVDLYLGSVPGGGFSFEWLSQNMFHCAIGDYFKTALNSNAETLPVFMPYLLGRGAPYMDYTPCAAWHDLTAYHTDADMMKGGIYGVLSALRQSCDLLEELIHPFRKTVMQSLANRETVVRNCANALWNKWQNEIPLNPEASLLGAAIIGAVAMKIHPSFAEARKQMVHTQAIGNSPALDVKQAEEYYRRYRRYAD